ncbi:uncharacterized protein LOC133493618 isoform X2 [Syngnathoides biaculeatus]|uniref:uncharacterized protein LOC133493618 isoform X2 n=1 Tax=Syngnathoides biaculeatus TaxID=300417 RepID=UPI002ADD4260|nr:uncharacterized protein LOC133493618 isoform X2 [Syngnathoides biaculeatus]
MEDEEVHHIKEEEELILIKKEEEESQGSQADMIQSARHLLNLLTSSERPWSGGSSDVNNHDARLQRQNTQSGNVLPQTETPSVHMEMTRSFPGKGRGKRRFTQTNLVSAKKKKPLDINFYLLPRLYEKTPTEEEQFIHMKAGLGRKTAHIDKSTTHEELCERLKVLFPKLGTITGGWLLYKSAGGWGRRKLTLIGPEDDGYTGTMLKVASRGVKNLFIVPIQEQLCTDPLQLTDEAFAKMPKAMCHKCRIDIPLHFLTEHIKSCGETELTSDKNVASVDLCDPAEKISMQACPVCGDRFRSEDIEAHASACGESTGLHSIEEVSENMPGPSTSYSSDSDDWYTISNVSKAISCWAQHFLQIHAAENPLLLKMDLRESCAENDMALISFYKRPNVQWAYPLNCRLEGDVAVGQGVTRFFFSTILEKLKSGFSINFGNSPMTRLFEGEPGHLVPSASHFLVESDMFLVAGRMIGHSFLHGGPRLSGLSPALVHVLLGGSPETATVTLEDCPDLDIRETINLLEGESRLSDSQKEKVQSLAYSWDLPCPTDNNRKWLLEKLLFHAVLGRVTRQIKQLRRGLKETPVWALVTRRPDAVSLLFPKEEAALCPEVVLQNITWPETDDGSDEDDNCSSETKSHISGYLRQFITNSTPPELKDLMKFWTGWETLPARLSVEIVQSKYPTAATCCETLRIPSHYKDYKSFKDDFVVCISSCQTGFGLL